jgi:hypothetical protein
MAAKVDSNKGVSPAIIAIAVVVLVAFLGWLGYKSFGPPPPPPVRPEAQKRIDEYDALAKRTHGDINKLTPEERDKLMRETGGFGAGILHKIAQDNGY